MVLLDALAHAVHDSEIVLGFGKALFCGQPKPLCRIRMVLLDALAQAVHDSEIALGFDITLFCLQLETLDIFLLIFVIDSRLHPKWTVGKIIASRKGPQPGFSRWLLPIADNDRTMGIRRRIRPWAVTIGCAPLLIGLIWR